MRATKTELSPQKSSELAFLRMLPVAGSVGEFRLVSAISVLRRYILYLDSKPDCQRAKNMAERLVRIP